MPLHDYHCSTCGNVQADVYRSCDEGAQSTPPTCACGTRMEWIPAVGSMDAKEPFQQFDTFDGRGQKVHVGSLHQLRQIERDSEQAARNGEGEHLTWRAYSQDRSNRYVNTHGEVPQESPKEEYVRKFGKSLRSQVAPEREYGPGVNDSNTSALGVVE